MRILVVDDIEVHRYMLETILKSGGYEVVSTANGKEALEKLRSEGADMIISDILMPVMDGFQLCQEIRADNTLKYVPFIFYTATYTDEKDEEYALKLGADKFLLKPMEPVEFMKIVKGVIRDAEEGKFRPQEPALGKTEETFELYSKRLVNKLEKKMVDLEKEISERKQAQERVKHLNLVLYAIRKVNQLIVGEKDTDRLLQGVCDNLIKNRGYYNAWIVLLDDTGRPLATAEAGLGKDFSPIVKLLKSGKMTDCVKKAQMQSDIVVTQDPPSTCTDCPLAKKYSGRGGFTARLEHDRKMYGLLTVSIPGDFALDEEEQSLFEEVAGDIAYAIHNIELEKEQKQAEKEIRRMGEEWMLTFDSITDWVSIQNKDFKIVRANRAYGDKFNMKPEELIGKPCYELVHGTKEPWPSCPHRQTLETKKAVTEEFFEPRLGIYLEIATSPIFNDNGEATGTVHITKDITERKKLEAQLIQAQKMEAIGTLAGGIAHDFNNILMAILGHADIAKMKLAEDSEAIDNLNQLKNAGNKARRLIQQILAFSRMGEQERIALSLTPLIKEALKFLRSTLPTSVEIRDYIEADPGIIEADATQIHQIMMNLCTNAGHAMQEEGGTLDVKLIRVEVDRQTALQHHKLHTGPHVRLTVTDTGCGMDSETLEHIFDPYFTTKEVGEGTGLGLSVVHGIVNTHNGVITVESEPEKGTTFHVYFPIIEKEEKIQEEDEGPLPTGNERILFVDDEQMILDIGKGILGELGYDVITKKSSAEALELFRAEPDRFDLVITDMTMPKMTGDQLARELMKIQPDIPIILCTGFSPKISGKQAKEIGIKAFAMKPLVRRDMANIVRKALGD